MSSASSAQVRVSQQIASGVRFDAVSQNAGAVTQASGLQQVMAQSGVYKSNLNELDGRYAESDQSLSVIHDSLGRIAEALGQSRNGSLNANDRNALGVTIQGEVAAIAAEIARQDSQGRAMFSGGLPDADHPALLVRPGQTLTTTIPLSAADQASLAALSSASWTSGSGLAGSSDAERAGAAALVAGLQDAALGARQAVGSNWSLVANDQDANQSVADGAEISRSALIDTDIAKSAADLATYTAQLQAARALFSRIQSTSLFDLIR
jgi:flagellin-like hook-associated protein FlgL